MRWCLPTLVASAVLPTAPFSVLFCADVRIPDNIMTHAQRRYKKPLRTLLAAVEKAWPKTHCTELDLWQYVSRVECNSFGLMTVSKKGKEVTGRMVFPLASFFNHSCEPNCEVQYGPADVLKVVTSQTVEKGEELTISYVDEDASTASRQRHLLQDYHFQCSCAKCCAVSKKKPGKQ